MNKTIQKIIDKKLVAVVRADSLQEALIIIDAIIDGGISIIEVTFTIPQAEEVLKMIKKKYKDSILIGAGTVLNEATGLVAINNGASFIVSPGFDLGTATLCKEKDIPYIPGCMTITEIMNAKKHSVDLFKLFPGSIFGPKYIKAIKGPLPDVLLMPTGGVSIENANDWIAQGASALGIGSALTKPAKNKNYKEITMIAKQFVSKIQEVNHG